MATIVEPQNKSLKTVKISKDSSYFLAAILAIIIWSTSFVGTKIAYTSFSPLTLGAARFVIATVVLGIIFLIKRDFTKPTVKDMGLISVSGILGITIYFALENIGVKLTTASNAALIVASYPAITALFELLLYRTKISWVKLFGIATAIVGVYLLVDSNHGDGGKQQLIGNIILIATGIVWAFYNFVTRKVVKKYSMITVSFYQTVAGTIAFIPLALVERASWQIPTLTSFLVLLYLGIFCSVTAFVLYNFGLRKLSPSSAVTLLNLVPVFGVISSVIFLHEVIRVNQLIGGAIVIAGVVLSVRQVDDNSARDISN
ncbi:permease [Desulfocucumis palustris]|uniref:Permease n=1 Tax=Desulfocucumis palustris TaxID=1898651 RepID=A0A2L2XF78_9FIRM|nr:EamA family transporter [Desulfocucumis palustris]GBF35009.1 permease [Desulfocucumis palustris]